MLIRSNCVQTLAGGGVFFLTFFYGSVTFNLTSLITYFHNQIKYISFIIPMQLYSIQFRCVSINCRVVNSLSLNRIFYGISFTCSHTSGAPPLIYITCSTAKDLAFLKLVFQVISTQATFKNINKPLPLMIFLSAKYSAIIVLL